jgi:hypothetical protein
LERLHAQRKLDAEEDIQLDYSEEYFKLKDALAAEGRPLEEEVKKMKSHIEKNQYPEIGWMAVEIFL